MTRVGDGRQNWVSSIKQTTSAVGNECTGLRGNSLASPIELRLIVNGQIGRRAFRNLFYMQPIGRMKSGDIFSTPFSPARRSLHALVFLFFVFIKGGCWIPFNCLRIANTPVCFCKMFWAPRGLREREGETLAGCWRGFLLRTQAARLLYPTTTTKTHRGDSEGARERGEVLVLKSGNIRR